MTDPIRTLPLADDESRPYWQAAAEGRLSLPRCKRCAHISFPPQQVCTSCQSTDLAWIDLSGKGRLHSYCVLHDTFVRGIEPPIAIAQVELPEQAGLRITTNILDCPIDRLRIGMPLEVAFQKITPEVTLPQFRPAAPDQRSERSNHE